ncbi:MAG: YegP family protein [Clostridia bacterium]|nr:YegP family protein [Clostridia bacterium]
MASKFEIRVTKNGGYRFALKAANGQVISTSQVYKTVVTCKKGIASVKVNALTHIEDQTVAEGEVATLKNPKYEIYNDKAGEFRFRLRAKNGQIILSSEGYGTKASCKNGIESIGKNAPDAEVVLIEGEED